MQEAKGRKLPSTMPIYKILRNTNNRKKRSLRHYQIEGIKRGAGKNSLYLAMEMRLGKTLTAIRWLDEKKDAKLVFVFAPKTVLISWERELYEEGKEYYSLVGLPGQTKLEAIREATRGYYLCNYEALLCDGIPSTLERKRPDAFILDESTVIKNPRAKTTKKLLGLCDSIKYKCCLSGLPAPESWQDIWSQMAFLNDGYWMGTCSFYKWLMLYATKDMYGWIFTPRQAVTIKTAYQNESFCLTRKEAGLGETKVYQCRSDALTGDSLRLYGEISNRWAIPSYNQMEEEANETVYSVVVHSWLRRLCGGFLPAQHFQVWKYAEALSIISAAAKNREPLIVWFCFNDEIKALSDYVKKMAPDLFKKVKTLTGNDSQTTRRAVVDDFQRGRIDYLFIQQKIGRFGLDLSRSDTAVYFSNAYNLELRMQSEDRIVLPGKNRPLLYIDFITKNTLEEKVIDDLRNKKIDARWLTARPQILDQSRSRP